MSSTARIKRKYKLWFYQFLIFNSILLFLLLIVDPYRLMPVHVTIPGINDMKPRLYDYQRYVKLYDIAYQKPKTIILGSSRVLWGIDPANPLLKQYPPVYNAGVLGPPMYEIAHYFEHALKNQPDLKRVILALDFYAFNNKFDDRDLVLKNNYGKSWQELMSNDRSLLFDFGATFGTIWNSLTRKPVMSLREDGRLIPDPLSDRVLFKSFFDAKPPLGELHAKNGAGHKQESDNEKKLRMRNELYSPFHLSSKDLDALRAIVRVCNERHIDLIIYIPVTYANLELNSIYQFGLWNDYKTFQRTLAHLHPFYDFMSWNQVTMNGDNYIDGGHSTFGVGQMIVGRIMGHPEPGTPKTFGRYGTEKTVDQHLNDLESEYLNRKKRV